MLTLPLSQSHMQIGNSEKTICIDDDLCALPEGCVANIISFTTPRHACRFTKVSSTFRSAADSDAVWRRFLPHDYQFLISRSSSPSLISRFSSLKALFLSLCDHPIIVDNGRKSFSLDKSSGKKCYMLSARDLHIVWGDTPRYWKWTFDPTSRFGEVANLVSVCWLEIQAKINSSMLSPSSSYTAYLVFRLSSNSYGLGQQPIDATVGLVGSEVNSRTVYLDINHGPRFQSSIRAHFVATFPPGINYPSSPFATPAETDGLHPTMREDGWLEIELGNFVNSEDDGQLDVSVLEIKGGNWKAGLIVEGIDIRPK